MKKIYTYIASALMALALGGVATACSDAHMAEVKTDD